MNAMANIHHVGFSSWAVGIGIDRDLSAGELRKISRRLLDMGTAVVRHARERGDDENDVAGTHETALEAAEFLLGMAGAFNDEAAAMDAEEGESCGRKLVGVI